MADDLKGLPNIASDPHDSSLSHVTGRSEYIDDRPLLKREILCGLVYSPYARAKLKKLDFSESLRIPGVVGVVTANDVSTNMWGTIFQDQPVLASTEVQYAGEVVAVLGAESPEALRAGLSHVTVEWEKLPAILSVDEAIAKKSFIGEERTISRGDVVEALKKSPKKLAGIVKIQGADHFYLESQAAVVYPKEDGQLEVHSSTQHPTETQHVVAKACGVPFKDVVCIAKRLGGGFGGKESQAAPIAAFAALMAKKMGRPARLALSKDDDMVITGKRNPFQIFYEVGFNPDGKIVALDAKLFSDGGAYADLSTSIMERAMLHSDNAYFISNMRVSGQVCRTNYHPHTAFRGFGGPKGVALIESILEDIARVTGKDALDIRKLNCYKPGEDITHYGQKVENNLLPGLFEKLEIDSGYRRRREEIKAWNQKVIKDGGNPRGLSLTAVKFGISFTTRFLNQGNALVIIHTDGSVQVSTGAVEMGQGVNSRIASIVAEEFGLPISSIRMMPTSTEKNANTSPTAASSGTDINGAAAQKACLEIKRRLAALALRLKEIPKEKWPSKTAGLGTAPEIEIAKDLETAHSQVSFENGKVVLKNTAFALPFAELVREAYLNRISLSEYGHYRIPNLGFDKLKGKGQAFLYYTQGVAASEVEIDRDTGEVKVKRVDILMDLGRPINYGLDVGQVTGGFIQGMGWVTTENLVYNQDGYLLSHSPSTYKIPSIQDIPRVFNANLVHNEGNTVNVKSTKAVGEPPLLLCLSVWTAIRDAIMSCRGNEIVPMEIPATSERVLRALAPEEFQDL
ncbi:MAG: xanthine dehydrogenase molybdopterin binding subunit [Proteobacteria bacterium]|nr:xanthine dehydrogenase molybdopterin binding subunit [Pseudomonadota bacterium]